MATLFGESHVGTVEIFHDSTLGWVLRGYSGHDRSGQPSAEGSVALDESLTVAALSTVPIVIGAEGFIWAGDWHVDEQAQTVWINTRVGAAEEAGQPSHESVEALQDAEMRWARSGIGAPTPKA